MKSERFTARQLFIERVKHREGPPIVYTVMSGRSSKLFTDHKALLRWIKWPSKTPTGDALREWLASFDKKPDAPTPELDIVQLQREGFGPECHQQDDSMENTKMVFDRYLRD
jgi:hypothetical protein|tara:strand:- start:231 stop:566 length:336 start_codon:yes stop_codon:yes gene_type:complete